MTGKNIMNDILDKKFEFAKKYGVESKLIYIGTDDFMELKNHRDILNLGEIEEGRLNKIFDLQIHLVRETSHLNITV